MAKSAVGWAGARNAQSRVTDGIWGVLRRRLGEALGFTLLLASLLSVLTLVTYDARDPSLNTAVNATPHNFLGHDGAIASDLLWQSFGLASFLIPALLAAWSFRLLLNRPFRRTWLRLTPLPLILVLGAVALSVLDRGAPSPPAGSGGVIGWGLQRVLIHSGLATTALPISMGAAALMGLLLLTSMGFS